MTSKLPSLLVVFALVATLFVAPAAAVDSSAQSLPEEAEVGSDVEASFELTQLFDEYETWTLEGETELQDATWTVKLYDQGGNQIDTVETDSLSQEIDIDDGVNRVEIRVDGTAPAVDNYSYEPPQQFVAANLTQTAAGGSQQAVASYQVHHYTQESAEARSAIDDARDAVDASSSDSGQALLNSAISSYENENFQNAIDSAGQAEEEASQNRMLRMGAIGLVAVIVLVALIGGGYRLYRSRQQSPSRLR